ncbi:MAG: hypothetical protein HY717_22945 [Planctomycetes bacterium]|nr:hypothetical protein [Planctomycetota bacterium]
MLLPRRHRDVGILRVAAPSPAGLALLYEILIAADPNPEVEALILESARGLFQREVTRVNLFAISLIAENR